MGGAVELCVRSPMTMHDERRAHEVQAAIAKVLLEEWDPIGVHDVPAAVGEYEM